MLYMAKVLDTFKLESVHNPLWGKTLRKVAFHSKHTFKIQITATHLQNKKIYKIIYFKINQAKIIALIDYPLFL